MKKVFIAIYTLVMVCVLTGCLSQQITSSWVNQEQLPEEPYTSICVIAMVPDRSAKIAIEDETADLLKKRGREAIKSTDLFTPKFTSQGTPPRERMIELMKDAGCDGVLTIAELDVKTESRYVPGVDPMPLPPYHYRYYNSYYSYYTYRYNQIYVPGYVVEEKTYFFETNFYDLETENLLWSIQTSAFEPSDAISWFYEHSKLITRQLKKEGILED